MHGAGVNCPIAQLRQFWVFYGSDYRIRIVTSPSIIADLTFITHPAISGQVPIAVRHSSGNFGASAHCHPSLVRQFRGKCPRPFIACQAISGQVPIAVHHSSGNFGAGAHCHPSLVRQFRGKRPLPSITRKAISGQVPTAVHRSSGNFGPGAHCHSLLVR